MSLKLLEEKTEWSMLLNLELAKSDWLKEQHITFCACCIHTVEVEGTGPKRKYRNCVEKPKYKCIRGVAIK